MNVYFLQADNSNIPVTIATNFTYGFLPSDAASEFAPPANSDSSTDGDISSFVGDVKDSFGALASTAGECCRFGIAAGTKVLAGIPRLIFAYLSKI